MFNLGQAVESAVKTTRSFSIFLHEVLSNLMPADQYQQRFDDFGRCPSLASTLVSKLEGPSCRETPSPDKAASWHLLPSLGALRTG